MRKLSVGMQNFEEIIQDERVYVDKTDLVYKLAAATNSKQYFLGRPRRFGKTLLVSTLKAYFEGKKELFQRLALGKLEKDWRRHPVIHLDMSRMGADLDVFEKRLIKRLQVHEKLFDLPGDERSDATTRFSELIENACEKFGEKVVVLIDEYDKQLVESIDDLTLNDSFRKKLKDFYGVLKSADENLRLSFLTGVTKFSKVSVFSDLNHLDDISMDYDYANICGITAGELWDNFEPELRQLAKRGGMTIEETMAEMQKRYDGYHFCENTEGLYNLFSVLKTLKTSKFRDYWFETGTPTFLIKLLERDRFDLSGFAKGVTVSASAITDYRADGNDPTPLLYQSGYLTIIDYDKNAENYTLDFPNREVRQGFFKELLRSYMLKSIPYADMFRQTLVDGDLEGFMGYVKTLLQSIPYDLNNKAHKATQEGYYHELLYVVLSVAGFRPIAEERNAVGRSDLVVETSNTVYIFEFKLDKSVDEALRQIEEKGYAAPYALANKKIVKIGVNFDSKTRNIADWKEGALHA
jgi:hypothetical protein